MRVIISRLLSIVFLTLAAVHFYWAFGGQWGFLNTLPVNEEGYRVLAPTKADSVIVATILLLISLFYEMSLKLTQNRFLVRIRKIGLCIIPVIFIIRAIGDFKYVGFFKEIKETEFANMDTMFYSPLCLVIAFGGLSLVKLKRNSVL